MSEEKKTGVDNLRDVADGQLDSVDGGSFGFPDRCPFCGASLQGAVPFNSNGQPAVRCVECHRDVTM